MRIRRVLIVLALLFFAICGLGAFASGLGEKLAMDRIDYSLIVSEMQEKATHTVTINWDNDSLSKTIKVREDLAWNVVNGAEGVEEDRVYSVRLENRYSVIAVEERSKEKPLTELLSIDNDIASLYYGKAEGGMSFRGLYTLPNGAGIKYADELGRPLKNVTEDLTLYACWIPNAMHE